MTTYYVSPTGSNSNNGTSLATPVLTITKGLSLTISNHSDIVYVMTGTYVETLTINQSGITLSAYPGNTPIIDGQTTLPRWDWEALIYVAGNYNNISGLEVKNSNINGVRSGGWGMVVAGHHNTLGKMNVHHTWDSGVKIQGDYNIIEDSLIWQSVINNSHSDGSVMGGWGAGLSAARNNNASALIPGITSYPILRRNKVFNNWGEGVICFEADHCTMEDNIVYDNWTTNLYLSDATNSLVQRNIVYVSSQPAIPTRNNSRPGLTLTDEVAAVPRSANNTIVNNLVYNAAFESFTWTGVANSGLNNVLIANNTIVDGNLYVGAGGGNNIVNVNSQIRNNIITGTGSTVPSNRGITFSNNNWGATPALAVSASDVIGAPKIARTGATGSGELAAAYFKVSGSSPVIRRGTPLTAVVTDFFLTPRPSVPTIGGHEYISLGAVGISGGSVATALGVITAGAVYPNKNIGLSGRSINSAQGAIASQTAYVDKLARLVGEVMRPGLGLIHAVIAYIGEPTTSIGLLGATLATYKGGLTPEIVEEHHGLSEHDASINISAGFLSPRVSYNNQEIGLEGVSLNIVPGVAGANTMYSQSKSTEWIPVPQSAKKITVQQGTKKITVQHTGNPVH